VAGPSLLAPFTVIDIAYAQAFKLYLNKSVGALESAITAPLLACVTIWIIIQGILVMRGDIDTRRGITKLVVVAIVVGLVTSSALYQAYVQDLFEKAIPTFVTQVGGNFGVPTDDIPKELDVVFNLGTAAFQRVAAEIPPTDELDALSFQGAQGIFYFAIWGIFSVYDLTNILTSLLVALGPIFLIGYLFEATQGIASRWLGQLIGYAILLLLTSIVASVVVLTIATFMAGAFAVTMAGGPTSGQLVGLYELDFFILTGNALVVALPAIAANIGGGVAAAGGHMGQSIFRRFAGGASPATINNMSAMQ
jgi:type IV secretion system protein VirB6